MTFDSLDHHILLDKLFQLNIGPAVLKWFQNYLSDRSHRVKGVDNFSEWRTMKGGIPQGSALGPLLYLVYVNDLPSQAFGGILLQYADDTTLICSALDIQGASSLMNSHLEVISQWTVVNRMALNLSKSSVMWFKSPGQHKPVHFPKIFVNNTPLSVVSKQKYLVLIFDSTLSWSSKVCRSMSYYLYLLNKQRLIFKTDLFKMLIESLVFSHVLYCLPVWGPSLTNANVNRLKCLQHRAIRLCLGLRKYDHISHHFHTLHWLPIGSMIQYRTLCAMHHQYFQPKHIPLVPPISFGRQHQYATRTTQLFAQPPRCRLSFTQKHFRSQAAHWWNAVPNDMLTSPTFQDD